MFRIRRGIEMTEINRFGNLTIEIVERWIDEQIKIMENRPWNNGMYNSHTSRKSIELLLEQKGTVDVFKSIKHELKTLDMMLDSTPKWREHWGLKPKE
jgi:hypothetical protein